MSQLSLAEVNQTIINPRFIQDREKTEKTTDQKIKAFIKYEHGEKQEHGIFGALRRLGTYVTSKINNATIMMGSLKAWDKERLLEGKFKKFQQIGGEGVLAHTASGDEIVGCYFSLSNFYQKIQEMGGKLKEINLCLDHPFFNRAQPIALKGDKYDILAVRIPYDPSLADRFNHPNEFLDFCHKNKWKVLWEEDMSEVSYTTWYDFSSRAKNMLIIPQVYQKAINKLKEKGSLVLEDKKTFESPFTLLDKSQRSSRAIVFDQNPEEVRALFAQEHKGLKIEDTGWELISSGGTTLLLENAKLGSQIHRASEKQLGAFSFYRFHQTSLDHFDLNDDKKGVVVLGMNQNNAFAQYSHEILKFLLMGVNVLAYDNAGKGLSQGRNDQSGLREAVLSMGEFLIEDLGFKEHQIIFKGQCSGGISISEASKKFHKSHFWVDQAPQNYWGSTKNILQLKAKNLENKQAKGFKDKWLQCAAKIAGFVAL